MLSVSCCFLLPLFILLNSVGCSSQKQDERIRSLEAEVKQLKTEVTALKQQPKAATEHHYELRNEGVRTWRFDTATGETCIQLTSPADWKRKETQSQSCACSDVTQQWKAVPMNTEEEIKSAEGYLNHLGASEDSAPPPASRAFLSAPASWVNRCFY